MALILAAAACLSACTTSDSDHQINCEQYEDDAFKMDKRGNHIEALGLYDKAIHEAEQSNNQLLLPAILRRVAEVRMQHEEFAEAEILLRRAMDRYKELDEKPAKDPEVAKQRAKDSYITKFDLANLLTDRKQYDQAEALYKELQAVPPTSEESLHALNEAYINMLKAAGKSHDANEVFIRNAVNEFDVRHWRKDYDGAVWGWLSTGSEETARRLDLCDRVAMNFGDNDPRKAWSLYFQSVRAWRAGRLESARTLAEESDHIYQQMPGPLPFDSTDPPQMLAQIATSNEHYDLALRYSQRAIEGKRKLMSPNNAEEMVNLAQALEQQATLLKRQNPNSDTTKLIDEAIKLRWGAQDWRMMLSESAASYLQGDVPGAKNLAELAIKKAKSLDKQPGVEAGEAWQIILSNSHKPEAVAALVKHVQAIEKLKGANSDLLVKPLLALGVISAENHKDGRQYFQRGLQVAQVNRMSKDRIVKNFKKRFEFVLEKHLFD
jgi:tetratricopeptide (TPR) repeat protein